MGENSPQPQNLHTGGNTNIHPFSRAYLATLHPGTQAPKSPPPLHNKLHSNGESLKSNNQQNKPYSK